MALTLAPQLLVGNLSGGKYRDLLKRLLPEDVKTKYGYQEIVDHDLIIVMEDEYKCGRRVYVHNLAGGKHKSQMFEMRGWLQFQEKITV